jgi:hypothetical protein
MMIVTRDQMVRVGISASTLIECWNVGIARLEENIESDSCASNVEYQEGKANHIIGALSEKVVSLSAGIPWTGKFNTKKQRKKKHIPDVGFIEVKTTPLMTQKAGCIIINSWDDDGAPVVLVYTGDLLNVGTDWSLTFVKSSPTVDEVGSLLIIGWAWGHEIKEHGTFKYSKGKPSHWLHWSHDIVKPLGHSDLQNMISDYRVRNGIN